jgi:hypothetical protein
MSVHQSLMLDHFFFAASEEAFAELKAFFLRFECGNHQHVQSDNDAWEGLYVRTRSQFYLEILKTRRPNCIGVCQKPQNPIYMDAKGIVGEFPELPWKAFDRSLEGQKWFTALSCDNYLDLTTPFNTWVMQYYQMNRTMEVRFKKFEIQTIFEIEVRANTSLIDRIKMNSAWFHAKKEYSQQEITFDFQTFYSDPLKMRIHLDSTVEGMQFQKLKFRFVEGFDVPAVDALAMKHFRFSKVNDHYELEKR